MNEITNHQKPMVFIEKGRVITNSLIVGEVFGKQHKNVVRDIESLHCSPEFFRLNFEPKIYQVKKGNGVGYLSNEAMYELTRDGLIFVVMGYTGTKAAMIKERYIAEFNRMETLINGPKASIGTRLKDEVRHFKAGVQIGKTAGLSKNQAVLKANRLTLKETGRNCLESIGVKYLPSPENEQDFVPSDLGRKLGGLSGKAVNMLLKKAGLQQPFRDCRGRLRWEPTDKGMKYAVIKEAERQHCTGTCQQTFWRESVLECLGE